MTLLTTVPSTEENHAEQAPIKQPMTAELKLVLHSDIAQALFNGHWRKGLMGLTQFAQLMKPLWYAASNDDPYAEWYLIKTYNAFELAFDHLEVYEQSLQKQLKSQRGFELSLYRHPQPLKQLLRFASPFAHVGARLLEKLDYINCLLYTLKKIGLAPCDNIRIRQIIDEVQAVFSLAIGWKRTGITREAVHQQTPLAQQLEQQYGSLPKNVLNREIKLSILPRIRVPLTGKTSL